MFLPLTESYFRNGKQELLGRLIKLQLRDGRLLTYRIAQVDVAFDWDIAERPTKTPAPPGAPDEHGHLGRLASADGGRTPHRRRVDRRAAPGTEAARLLAGAGADAEEPEKHRPEQRTPQPTPTPEPVVEPDEPLDTMTLVLGSGAILLGATLVAVYVVRRP